MEPTTQPELLTPEDGRSIRIGLDVLLVKALTGIADGVPVLETVAKPGRACAARPCAPFPRRGVLRRRRRVRVQSAMNVYEHGQEAWSPRRVGVRA